MLSASDVRLVRTVFVVFKLFLLLRKRQNFIRFRYQENITIVTIVVLNFQIFSIKLCSFQIYFPCSFPVEVFTSCQFQAFASILDGPSSSVVKMVLDNLGFNTRLKPIIDSVMLLLMLHYSLPILNIPFFQTRSKNCCLHA